MLNCLNNKMKKYDGFGLLELMLSMVVVALLLIMATRYYQSARTSARVNAAINLIQASLTAADNIGNAQGGYTAAINAAALTPFLPNNSLQTPWGTTLTVSTAGANSTSSVSFGIIATISDCQALIAAMQKTANSATCKNDEATIVFNYNHNA